MGLPSIYTANLCTDFREKHACVWTLSRILKSTVRVVCLYGSIELVWSWSRYKYFSTQWNCRNSTTCVSHIPHRDKYHKMGKIENPSSIVAMQSREIKNNYSLLLCRFGCFWFCSRQGFILYRRGEIYDDGHYQQHMYVASFTLISSLICVGCCCVP